MSKNKFVLMLIAFGMSENSFLACASPTALLVWKVVEGALEEDHGSIALREGLRQWFCREFPLDKDLRKELRQWFDEEVPEVKTYSDIGNRDIDSIRAFKRRTFRIIAKTLVHLEKEGCSFDEAKDALKNLLALMQCFCNQLEGDFFNKFCYQNVGVDIERIKRSFPKSSILEPVIEKVCDHICIFLALTMKGYRGYSLQDGWEGVVSQSFVLQITGCFSDGGPSPSCCPISLFQINRPNETLCAAENYFLGLIKR